MRKWILIGIVGVLVLGAVGVLITGAALAQVETPQTPETTIPFGGHPGFGRSMGGQVGLEAAAEALGMSADELATQLWGGRSLADLAAEQGIDLADVQAAIEEAQAAAMRVAIQQAAEAGSITQEHADWLLTGIEQGFQPGLRFGDGGSREFRGGFGRGTGGQVGWEAAAEALGMTADELSAQLWGGKTLADLAAEKGVDLADVQAAVQAAQDAAMSESIQQAAEGGAITQAQADWLLEGLEKGFIGEHGFGRPFVGRGFHGHGPQDFDQPGLEPQTAPSNNS